MHRMIQEVKDWYGLENFPPRLNHVKPKTTCNQHSLAMPTAWSQVKKSQALISSAFRRSDISQDVLRDVNFAGRVPVCGENPSPRGKAPPWVTSHATKNYPNRSLHLYIHPVYVLSKVADVQVLGNAGHIWSKLWHQMRICIQHLCCKWVLVYKFAIVFGAPQGSRVHQKHHGNAARHLIFFQQTW